MRTVYEEYMKKLNGPTLDRTYRETWHQIHDELFPDTGRQLQVETVRVVYNSFTSSSDFLGFNSFTYKGVCPAPYLSCIYLVVTGVPFCSARSIESDA